MIDNWKTAYKQESYGSTNFGIEIRVALDRPLTEKENMAMYRIADQIEDIIMRETMRLDPEITKRREEEKKELLSLFGDRVIFAEEIPNGYGNSWHYSQSPWYKVTTSKGVVTLGWRKRVIQISWEPRVSMKAEELFSDDVTKDDHMIHAWGYDKAKQYIDVILSS